MAILIDTQTKLTHPLYLPDPPLQSSGTKVPTYPSQQNHHDVHVPSMIQSHPRLYFRGASLGGTRFIPNSILLRGWMKENLLEI